MGGDTVEEGPSGAGDSGVQAAVRHFPARLAEIEALARASERFRDICEELAAAEAALVAVDQLDERFRAERRLEWLSYVRSALRDIDNELQNARIVSIGRTSRSDG